MRHSPPHGGFAPSRVWPPCPESSRRTLRLPRAVANFGVKAFLRRPVSAEEIHAALRWATGEDDAPPRVASDDETADERGPRASLIPILDEAIVA